MYSIGLLFLSIILLFLGWFLLFKTPKRNNFIGYRTKRSRKTDKNWKIANKSTGRMLMISSFFYIIFDIVIMAIMGLEDSTLPMLWALIGYLVLFVILIIKTESRLKKIDNK